MELTTWKAVAAHLGVHQRTAQAWEVHRALPVHHLPGGRGRVTTTTEALDAWKQGASIPAPMDPASFRWPLGPGVDAEVRFIGHPITSAHVEVLRQYLDVAKHALTPRRRVHRRIVNPGERRPARHTLVAEPQRCDLCGVGDAQRSVHALAQCEVRTVRA